MSVAIDDIPVQIQLFGIIDEARWARIVLWMAQFRITPTRTATGQPCLEGATQAREYDIARLLWPRIPTRCAMLWMPQDIGVDVRRPPEALFQRDGAEPITFPRTGPPPPEVVLAQRCGLLIPTTGHAILGSYQHAQVHKWPLWLMPKQMEHGHP